MKYLYHGLKRFSHQYKVEKKKTHYIIISLNMIEIDERDTVVLKLKNLQDGTYVIKTPREIIFEPQIVFNLCKQDLIQVSYLAGYEHNVIN